MSSLGEHLPNVDNQLKSPCISTVTPDMIPNIEINGIWNQYDVILRAASMIPLPASTPFPHLRISAVFLVLCQRLASLHQQGCTFYLSGLAPVQNHAFPKWNFASLDF
jgi:hypothetical protein